MCANIASTWIHKRFSWLRLLYARKIEPRPVQIKRLFMGASGLIAGVAMCYIALCLLGFIVLGRLCEYAVLRKYLGICGTENGTTSIDAYSSALANVSQVLIYHDAYEDLSLPFSLTSMGMGALSGALQTSARDRSYIETTRGLVEECSTQLMEASEAVRKFRSSLHIGGYRIQLTNDMLVDAYLHEVSGKMAYVWEILGSPHDSALEDLEAEFLDCVNETLQIFEQMQGKAENTKTELDHLGILLERLSDSAQYGVDVIQDDVEKRTWEGYVYPHVPCRWTNLCGLIGRPRPMRLAYDVGSNMHTLNKASQYSKNAGVALGPIRAVHDAITVKITEAKHALGGLLIEANETAGSHRKGHKKALVMEWKRGGRRLRKCLSDISAIDASFRSLYRKAKPLKQPLPSFEFPTLNI